MSKRRNDTWRVIGWRMSIFVVTVLLMVLGTSGPATSLPPRDQEAEAAPGESVSLALGLELIIPGAGLVYVGEYGPAMGEWLGIGAGAALVFTNIPGCGDGCDNSPGLLALGIGLIVAARLYGIIAAPVYAQVHTDDAAKRTAAGVPRMTGVPGPLNESGGTGFYVLLPALEF